MLDTGEHDLPAVVCLHSLFLGPHMFDRLVASGKGRFRFLQPTFPGQGDRIDEATAPVTMDDCVEDLASALERAGVRRYSLVAQSMGGDVAVRLAASNPDAVEALVLIGTSVRAEPPEQMAEFRAVADHIEEAGFDAGMQQVVLEIMLGASTRSDPAKQELVDEFRRQFAALPARLHHAARGVIEREDATGLLASITAPTLVVNGEEDVVRPPAWSADMVRGISGARQVELKGVGHSPTLEAPEVVLPLVLGFLEDSVRST
ncbi:alpha/beta fold hydrolase [Nonomuraea lactucae]|uniref:alpha/beta fold hydrolase n=1 Tax=Nonomuraea lactucae TaxID=2249762 RepID=UPI000DE39A89|nr:alpha/beta hydrolase [Nonomuraea lactucae]